MSPAVDRAVLQRIREEAAQRFEELGWPTTRIEEWKYTSLATLAKSEWKRAGGESAAAALAAVDKEAPVTFGGRALAELVFVDGVFVPEASTRGNANGVVVMPLAESEGDAFERHFARYANYATHAMTALNTANAQDGAFVQVSDAVEGFIHLRFVGSDGYGSHPRNLIVAGAGSQIAIVESYSGTGRYFTNVVTEVVAGEGAVVDHTKIECESAAAFHVGTLQIHQERSSSATSRTIAIGGGLVRNEVNAALAGEGASLVLDGLFIGSGTQHIDNHTVIEHAKPHCDSIEMFKGILDQNARGIFDGKIVVQPDAQKTVSRQTNNNLLLSETAIVDSKPTLEIYNDDVKCNHGSTIGQLEEESLFYLRSRGIGENEARNLLVHAFASEVVDRMTIEPVREEVRRAMFRSMPDRLPERRESKR